MSPSRIPPALRQRVAEPARHHCGYCLTSERLIGPLLEIDHSFPEARGGTSDEANLWLACPLCNSHTSDRISVVDPETGAPVPLFNPRLQRWDGHFVWTDGATSIAGTTDVGRATIVALQMNHPDMVTTRALWVSVGWHPPSD